MRQPDADLAALRDEVAAYLRRTEMAPSTLGIVALKDQTAIALIRDGLPGVGPARRVRLRAWMAANPEGTPAEQDARAGNCSDCGRFCSPGAERCRPCQNADRRRGMVSRECRGCGARLHATRPVTGLCVACWRVERKMAPLPPRVALPTPPPFLTQHVLAAIPDVFDVPAKDVLAKSNYREHVRARQAAMAVMRERGMSFPAIGRRLGGRDHSTANYGAKQAAKLAATDPAYAARIDALRKAVG